MNRIKNSIRNPNVSTWSLLTLALTCYFAQPAAAVPVTSSLNLWMDAADTSTLWVDNVGGTQVTTNGQSISEWEDKSGNGYVATIDAGTVQYATDGLGGSSPVGRFGSDRMLISNYTDGGDATMFVVFNATSTSTGQIFNSNRTTGTHGGYIFDMSSGFRGRVYDGISTANGEIIAPISTSTNYIGHYTYDNGNSAELFVNGLSQGTDPTVSTITSGTADAGFGAHPSASVFFAGDLAELIVYDRLLTPEEQNEVGYYLANKWGISASFTAPPVAPVPEPNTALLAAMGAVLMLRTRRRV